MLLFLVKALRKWHLKITGAINPRSKIKITRIDWEFGGDTISDSPE
ncbi:hypothetical protein DOT_2415 [Desulfosporosinus sp. OT]|nr:hypothetical protein DOT_2415 [Desulfosporosinus sp. OT]